MTTHRMFTAGRWVDVPVASYLGEALVTPNVAALLVDPAGRLLLQRRDKPEEDVRGLLELPGGKWLVGESIEDVLRREVAEETGLEVLEIAARITTIEAHPHRPFSVTDDVIVSIGHGGAYPALHIAIPCSADGEPRPQLGETTDPRWWDLASVRSELAHPERFVGPAAAILSRWLA